MGIFYCKCKKCNHTGNISLPSEKHVANFKCSKCGSTDVISVYRDTNNAAYRHITRKYNETSVNDHDDLYHDELYEEKMFEEERLLDAVMMAPTGWEDDKEIQDYVGILPEDIPSDSEDEYFPEYRFTPKILTPKNQKQTKTTTKCEHPGCTNAGTCRAPKTRDLSEYWCFCKEHAAEYNKNWNYYANMSPNEIDTALKQETTYSVLNI